jgi:hypothetical protein
MAVKIDTIECAGTLTWRELMIWFGTRPPSIPDFSLVL